MSSSYSKCESEGAPHKTQNRITIICGVALRISWQSERKLHDDYERYKSDGLSTTMILVACQQLRHIQIPLGIVSLMDPTDNKSKRANDGTSNIVGISNICERGHKPRCCKVQIVFLLVAVFVVVFGVPNSLLL